MRQDGNEGIWRIPELDRQSLVRPAVEDWPKIALGNRKLNEARSLHRQIVAGAIAFTEQVLGEKIKLPSERDPMVLVTGHQPRFYHPGVWFKNFLLAEVAAQSGAIAINLIVDTDEAGVLEAAVPLFADGWQQEKIPLLTAEANKTFEFLAPPTSEQITKFISSLRELGTEGYQEQSKANVQRFLALLSEDDGGTDLDRSLRLAEWLTKLRRLYEGEQARYLEYPVSLLAETSEFKGFMAELINDAAFFTKQYNQTLAAYRRAHGYRYRVNPFPDLIRDEANADYELPLWLMKDGVRAPAYVKTAQGHCSLHAAGEAVLSWSGKLVAEQLEGVALRPRGMTLTLFMRLFGCDLFLHGVGGAKYDGATSQFIRDYYQVEPPEYAGATLTVYPHLNVHEVSSEELSELEELIRDVEYNPDRHLKEAGLSDLEQEELQDMVRRKELLITQIKAGDANRKEIGLEIKKLNRSIGSAVSVYQQELTRRLAEKKEMFAASKEAKRRDYAYFLFDPGEIAQFAKQ